MKTLTNILRHFENFLANVHQLVSNSRTLNLNKQLMKTAQNYRKAKIKSNITTDLEIIASLL